MKIVFVSDHFSTPDVPGILRTWQVAKHLAESGDQVVVIAPAQHYLFADRGRRPARTVTALPGGLHVKLMRTHAVKRGTGLSRLRCYAEQAVMSAILTWREGPCDLVVAGLTPSMLGVGAYLAARLRRIPFVVDERDLALDAAEQAGLLPLPVLRAAQTVERFLFARASLVLAVTPGLRSMLVRRGVPQGKVILAPNGFEGSDTELAPFDRDAVRTAMGWADQTVVLYAGGLGPMYDLDVVLTALTHLDHSGYLLVVIGEGEYKQHYRERCQRERLPAQFPGPVAKSDLHEICRAADIGIVPLRKIPRSELVLSNKLFDYLGAACPVIVTGPGDMADLVQKAGAGIVVPAGDPLSFAGALRELADCPGNAREMGRSGRRFVLAEWTRAKSVRIFRSALHDIAEGANLAERERIRSVYGYYDSDAREQRKRDFANDGVRVIAERRASTLDKALAALRLRAGARVLDVGCGTGGDLRRIATSEAGQCLSLHGIDLLPDRIERAQQQVPQAVLLTGSAEALPYSAASFDVVLAATLFSSILDRGTARTVAQEMTRVLASDGVILCYDVRQPNPWNPHTRPIRRRELQQLFPGADIRLTSLTLLPPLTRRLSRQSGRWYGVLHAIPALRSHYLAEIRPPRWATGQRCPASGVRFSRDTRKAGGRWPR